MKLYTYWRSSAAYRARIALNLKGLEAEQVPVHLINDGGQQHSAVYSALNPQELVPALEDEGRILTQSMALIEYLDETHPEPPLLPGTPFERARVRAIAQAVACDIHPLNNLRVMQYLEFQLGIDPDRRKRWTGYWIMQGFEALEKMLQDTATGTFCHGESPTLADICLVPQVYNAKRFEIDLEPFPTIARVNDACLELDAFAEAAPEKQPDAP